MSLDDRLRAGTRRLAERIEADPEGAIDGVLRRGRARRRLRLAGAGLAGLLALGGIVGTAVTVFPLADLRPEGPKPGSTPSVVQASPGLLSGPQPSCSYFNVSAPRDLDTARSACGMRPAVRRVEGGTAHQLRTSAGEPLWLVLPDGLRGGHLDLATPGILVTIEGRSALEAPIPELVPVSAEDAAFQACRAVELPCLGPVAVHREDLPDGAELTRWRLEPGQWLAHTVERGQWTLTVAGTRIGAERVARAITWTDHADGYLTARSIDPKVSVAADWASVNLWLGTNRGIHTARILPGCRMSEKEPDLDGRDYGADLSWGEAKGDSRGHARWCADGRYLIDVDDIDEAEAERLHGLLRVVPALG